MSSETIYHCDRCKRETPPAALWLVGIEIRSKIPSEAEAMFFTPPPRAAKSFDLCDQCIHIAYAENYEPALETLLVREGSHVICPAPMGEPMT